MVPLSIFHSMDNLLEELRRLNGIYGGEEIVDFSSQNPTLGLRVEREIARTKRRKGEGRVKVIPYCSPCFR